MNFIALFILFACLHLSAAGIAQKINISGQNTSLEKVFKLIQKQTDYHFIYRDEWIKKAGKLNVDLKNATLNEALEACFRNQPLTYTIVEKLIVVKEKNMQDVVTGFIPPPPITIKGRVFDDKGEPVSGASVVVKGTDQGTTTDSDGNFTITVEEDATLRISYVGFEAADIRVKDKTDIEVRIVPLTSSLNDIVVVGWYGNQRKTEVTSAVASVQSKDFVKGVVKDIGQLLQGKIAGLTIVNPSGDPSDGSQILLRGISTLYASTQPAVLIDGIPGNLNTVAPEDIERIDVLKDGSAAAIYGTLGTNGVILITTRKPDGKSEPTISYNGYVSTQSWMKLPDMLNADEYRRKISEGVTGFEDYGASTDWLNLISRKRPVSHSQQLTLRGGNVKTNYLATVTYRDMEGIFRTTENRKINSRIDVNHSMFDDKLKINFNIIGDGVKSDVGLNRMIFRSAVRYNPTSPVYNDDGTYFENFSITENYNPVAMVNERFGDNHSQSTRVSANVTWMPFSSLSIKALVSDNKSNGAYSYGETKQNYSTTRNGLNGFAQKSQFRSHSQLLEVTTEYTRSINSHRATILGGYSYQEGTSEESGMENHDFPVGNYSYVDNIGLGQALAIGQASQFSSKIDYNKIGFFGRLSYVYREKYFLLANLRYEAVSQLAGTKRPWGTFPALSIGWRLDEEDFIKNISFIDNLKVRLGYGVTGTAPDASFLAVQRLGYSGSFLIDGHWLPSIVPVSNPNPYLKWEEKKETNLGFDFSFIKGRINGSLDFYKRKTEGLLFDYQVPSPPNLFPTTTANVGVMENKGIELMLSFIPVRTKKFSWNSNITFSTNRNKLVTLENDLYTTTNPFFDVGLSPVPIYDVTHRVEVGQPIGNFWGFKVVDITDDGHWVYEDKDGKPITTPPDPASDRKIIGNGLPRYYGGFNNTLTYGRFDLNVTMRGAFGFEIINAQRMLFENIGFTTYNQLNSAYDKVFGKAVMNTDVNLDFNSYYVEKGDYWKIDNITLGYDLIGSSKFKHIQSARVYVSTLNTFIISGYKGMDPEVNQIGLEPGYDNWDKYPTTRIFTLGVNVTLK
ncbi:MAG: SusC/RagA family TonB-linked outer membrane protein [Chitinophagaceae bacterium]|nr:SusC/RagA family TonB-linked outer membrane protein [Chitinophagaceae bacterium]